MKASFWLGVVLGFGGLLAGAHFWPWFAHVRLPSQTSVVANGGRAEQFVIRLPADRLAAVGTAGSGLRAAASPGALPADFAGAPVLVEHYKVRDSAGNVIGLAARHWSEAGDSSGTAWSLLIPSRGALLLTAAGEPRAAVDTALRRAGHSPGAAWSGEISVPLVPPGESSAGTVASGTAEFSGLTGRFEETWTLTGVTETGELRGTIALDTVIFRGS